MNLAVIGSGGREHAICYKLKQSPKIKKLICIPGNAGTQKIAENIKEDLKASEVSTFVNSPLNNGEPCISPVVRLL